MRNGCIPTMSYSGNEGFNRRRRSAEQIEAVQTFIRRRRGGSWPVHAFHTPPFLVIDIDAITRHGVSSFSLLPIQLLQLHDRLRREKRNPF